MASFISSADEPAFLQEDLNFKEWVASRGNSCVVYQNRSLSRCIIMEQQVVFKIARDEDVCRELLFADSKQTASLFMVSLSLGGETNPW
jgi:hypothetical protein